MNAQTHSRLRGVALATIGLVALAGCDRFKDANDAAPAITDVFLSDQTRYVSADRYDPALTTIDTAQPTLSLVRIRFNKTMDGSTIQKSTNFVWDGSQIASNSQVQSCQPADGIVLTRTPAGGGTPEAVKASVCYDPSGPDIVITPAVEVCRLTATLDATTGRAVQEPVPMPKAAYESELNVQAVTDFPGFDRGFTYTITATGVKDGQGKAMAPFTYNLVVPAALNVDVNSAAKSGSGSGVRVATADGYSDLIVSGTPLATPVPAGTFDADTQQYAVTDWNYAYGYSYFGPDIRAQFDAPMCYVTGSVSSMGPDFCDPTGAYIGATPGIAITVPPLDAALPATGVIDYDTQSDLVIRGDARAIHLFPLLPLEDGQTYTVAMDTTVTDAGGAALAAAGTYTFTAEAAAAPSIQVTQPANGTTNFPMSADLADMSWWDSHGIEFVASQPLKVTAGRPDGTITVSEVGGSALPLVSADVLGLDSRNRWFAIGGTAFAGTFAFKPGTTYEVSLTGLSTASGTPVPDKTWSFTTASFAPISNDLAAYFVSVFPAKGTVDPVGTLDPADTLVRLDVVLWGKVDFDPAATRLTDAAPIAPLGDSPGIAPIAGATATLTNKATGATVPGTFGQLVYDDGTGTFVPWYELAGGDGNTPSGTLSKVTFVPNAPLDYLTQYELVITGLKWTDAAATGGHWPLIGFDGNPTDTLTIPFTTRAFQVRRFRSNLSGSNGNVLTSGAHNVTWSTAHPIRIDFRGIPDTATYAAGLTDQPENAAIVVVDNGGKHDPTGRGLIAGTTTPSPYVKVNIVRNATTPTRVDVTPVVAAAGNNTYTVLVKTTQVSSTSAQAKAPAASLKFTSTDLRDATGAPTCTP